MKKISDYFLMNACIFLTVMWTVGLFAQSDLDDITTTNQQVWIDFYPHFKVNDKLEYYGDIGYRATINNDLWKRIYARPSFRYHMSKKWEVHAGLGLFYIFNKSISDRFEITPWQGVQLNWPTFQRLKFKHLLKIEERISYSTQNWSSSFELRLRLKIGGRFDFRHNNPDTFWFIPFYVEGFVPVSDKLQEIVRNKARAGLGVGHNASDTLRLSFIVNWQTSGDGFTGVHDITDIGYQLKVRLLWTKKTIIKNSDIRN